MRIKINYNGIKDSFIYVYNTVIDDSMEIGKVH
jgi:hypothetical protein